jgi:plastocyanin
LTSRAGLAAGLLGAAAVISLAACGGGGSEPEVRMEAQSFEPAVLTVEVGETVTFVNEGDEDKWPASNDHPTHELYPGFDARRAILPGDSWSFTFERPGRWGYHDHLSPEIEGEVVVEAAD